MFASLIPLGGDLCGRNIVIRFFYLRFQTGAAEVTWVIADHSAAPGSKELTVTKGQQVEVLENGSNISGVNTSEWTHVRLLVAPGQLDPPPEGLVPTSALKQPPPVSSKTSPSRKTSGQQQQQLQQPPPPPPPPQHCHQQQTSGQVQAVSFSGGIVSGVPSSSAIGTAGSSSPVITNVAAAGPALPDETGKRCVSCEHQFEIEPAQSFDTEMQNEIHRIAYNTVGMHPASD